MCIACTANTDTLLNGGNLLIDQKNADWIKSKMKDNTLKVFVDDSLNSYTTDFASRMIDVVDDITKTNITQTHSYEDAQIVLNQEPNTLRPDGYLRDGVGGVAWSSNDRYFGSIIEGSSHPDENNHVLLHEFLHTLGMSHHPTKGYEAHRKETAMGDDGSFAHTGTLTALDIQSLQEIHGANPEWTETTVNIEEEQLISLGEGSSDSSVDIWRRYLDFDWQPNATEIMGPLQP